ncbi:MULTISPECIES: LysR substrate-binding domain-containing protein [unclassified Variovorax]|uniref:LysR substrate-binding domain-containing protein n=1 Tax=unclassified Variovorax TaxID=663243 RepID=UPI0008D5C0A9|nr:MULTISPECIES: LysR substrate-binding domain-containing protein [unclassified Variovorax]SEK17348.1 DNA-binding transcriptional regulator, LysR family [Variovorax sp. OK202]SFE80484.1 DNA-binding transcriptional regulator, LysR family [Variovorax sp. OK212]
MSSPANSSAFSRAVQLRHLRCFVAVAQERHLGRAASRLSLSQPAVSKTLGELEEMAKSQLIRRTIEGRRGMLGLTDAGERLLSHSIAVLDAVGAGGEALSTSSPSAADSLRLGVLTCLCAGAMPRSLSRLLEQRPALQVTVETGSNLSLMDALRAGSLDVVLGRMSDPKLMQGLSFELLGIETLAWAVRPGHAFCGSTPPLQTLLDQTVILHPPGTVPRQRADTLFAARALAAPARIVETSDFTLARAMVLRSDAVWIAPRYAVEEDFSQGSLVQLSVDAAGTDEPVGIFRKVGKPNLSSVEHLAQLLREDFKKLP